MRFSKFYKDRHFAKLSNDSASRNVILTGPTAMRLVFSLGSGNSHVLVRSRVLVTG
jgi:hypothetical protein